MKSRSQLTRLLTFGLALSCFAFLLACQHAQLAPYHKFENDTEVPRIPLDEAKKDFDAGTAVFVDSRAQVSYDQEHVTGAVNIPVGSGDEKFSSLPKNKKIIVYCS